MEAKSLRPTAVFMLILLLLWLIWKAGSGYLELLRGAEGHPIMVMGLIAGAVPTIMMLTVLLVLCVLAVLERRPES